MELLYLIDKAAYPQTEARPVSDLLAISIRALPANAGRPSSDSLNTD